MHHKTNHNYGAQQPLLFGLAICLQLLTTVYAEPTQGERPPITGLIFNEDDTEFFSNRNPSTVTGKDIDRMVDFYADAGVKVFVCAVVGERTTYDSDVWESYWDDYDPDGPDDQPRLRNILPEELDEYRQTFDLFVAIDQQGVDYPARVIQQCRARGVAAWLGVRMNDCHGLESNRSPWPSKFMRSNPHLARVQYQKFFRADYAMNHGSAEIRERYRAVIEEMLDRYDMDGLELDFCRQPLLFGIGQELEGGKLLTQWMAEIHDLIKAAETRHGHPICLGVRVPSRPETCRNLGLDVMSWARHGWIDLVVASGCAMATSTDFNTPMMLWRELLRPYGVSLAGGIEPSATSCHLGRGFGLKIEKLDPALLTGAAVSFLYGGADAVYLFNFFRQSMPSRHPSWTDETIGDTFAALNSLETLATRHRRHVVTYREITAPGELLARQPILEPGEVSFVDAALPARGKYGIFRLQTGPKPTGRKVRVILEFAQSQNSIIRIRVNGVLCDLEDRQKDGKRLYFDVPEEARSDEAHVIEVYADGPPFTITWVEMDIAKTPS